MNDYTLVVIHAQPDFVSDPQILAGIEREVSSAVSLGMPIILLELQPNGANTPRRQPTHESINSLVSGYDRCAIRENLGQNGAPEVLSACRDNGFAKRRFRVCGAYVGACVLDTVLGVHDWTDATIEVVRAATNRTSELVWKSFQVSPRINLA